MSDPLNNPREVWRMHYDHRTMMGKWGRLLRRAFWLRDSGQRYMDELRRDVEGRDRKRDAMERAQESG